MLSKKKNVEFLCIRDIELFMYAAFSDAFGRTAPFIWHQEAIPLLFVPSKSNLEAKNAEVGVNKAASGKWSGRIWQDGIHEMNNYTKCFKMSGTGISKTILQQDSIQINGYAVL